MGCVSSKLLKKHVNHDKVVLILGNSMNNGGDVRINNHVVSLTSSTYGALQLDHKHQHSSIPTPIPIQLVPKRSPPPAPAPAPAPELEVINTWELMSDLEQDDDHRVPPASSSSKKKKKEVRSPFKTLTNPPTPTLVNSPKGVNKLVGKENNNTDDHLINQGSFTTPKGRVFKPWKRSTNSTDRLRKGTSFDSPRRSTAAAASSTSTSSSSRRRSLGPLFDPDLIHSFEKELSQEEEQIKKMVSPKKKGNVVRKGYDFVGASDDVVLLAKYEEKCPPGGEHCVVIYTTTLRGIRKTFEDCNAVRAVIESYHIRLIERDISMDSGFKEELRKLMGTKEVKVPLVFVKGRLIGGANEVVRLDEEGKLQGLLQGIPMAVFGCQGCGGIRFVMCMECNGSCKVLDQDCKSMIRCGHCNENGLIQCPICCCSSN